MATPFGGGVSRFGTICGALVGGSMALGFCYGRTKAEEKDKREKTYAKVQEMLREFEKEFGTLQCKGLDQFESAGSRGAQEISGTQAHQPLRRIRGLCRGKGAPAFEEERKVKDLGRASGFILRFLIRRALCMLWGIAARAHSR